MPETQHLAARSYVRHQTRFPKPKWYIGVDLGQRQDHSAVSVLELTWQSIGQCATSFAWLFEPTLVIRNLERYPLGTSYETIHKIIADRVKELDARLMSHAYAASPLKDLVIDAGGPGGPIVDRLRTVMPKGVNIRPVMITGGSATNSLVGGFTGVPRKELISRLILMIVSGSIVCPRGLPGYDRFEAEMLELSGTTSHPAKAKDHDDLVLATALAAWAAVGDNSALVPGASERSPEIGFQTRRLL